MLFGKKTEKRQKMYKKTKATIRFSETAKKEEETLLLLRYTHKQFEIKIGNKNKKSREVEGK